MKKLDRCKHCGSLEVDYVTRSAGDGYSVSAACMSCGIRTKDHINKLKDYAMDQAAIDWNRTGYLNAMAKDFHQNALDKGWYDGKERTFLESLTLMHCELSEAAEEYRNGMPDVYCQVTKSNAACLEEGGICCGGYECLACFPDRKPEGIAIELIDCVIRIFDTCSHMGIDIDKAIAIKHAYNQTRPYRHGGKKA